MGTKQKWYVEHSKGRSRPLSSKQLRKLARAGVIKPETQVQLAGSELWVAASKVKGLFDDSSSDRQIEEITHVSTEPPPPQVAICERDLAKSSSFLGRYLVIALVGAACLISFMFGHFVDRLKNAQRAETTQITPLSEDAQSSKKAGDTVNPISTEPSGQPVVDVTLPTDMALDLVQLPVEELDSEVESSPQSVRDIEGNEEAIPAKEIAKQLKSSTVTVRATLPTGESLGSGFFVQDTRTLITCLHVVKGAKNIVVEIPGGKKTQCLVYQAFSEPWDLVVLRTSESIDATPLTLAMATPEQGETVFAYGAPKGFTGTLSSGLVSAVRSDGVFGLTKSSLFLKGTTLIQFTAAISPGSSGGPVVDERGCVVGIAASKWTAADDVNFAIAATHLAALLEQAKNGKENLLAGLPERPKEPDMLKKDELNAAAKDFLSEMKKQREEDVNRRKSIEAIADRQQKTSERKVRATYLQSRISAGNQYLRQLESEKAVLSDRYRKIEGAGSAVWASGMQLKRQVFATRSHIGGVKQELLYRQEAAQKGLEYHGDPRSNAALALDLQRLRDTLVRQEAEARRLEAEWLGLDQEARALNQKYASMKQQYKNGVDLRNYLIDELEALRTESP